MKHEWTSRPHRAWTRYIQHAASYNQRWLEDSTPISDKVKLSKRELFGLIILAHACDRGAGRWRVGFNTYDGEPNDGFLFRGSRLLRVEHKLIAQFEPKEVLTAIKSTYEKYSGKGRDYGSNRILLIHANKDPDSGPGGLVWISDFTNSIDDDCPFDLVLTLGYLGQKEGNASIGRFHLHKHFPPKDSSNKLGQGFIVIEFDWSTGHAKVPFAEYDFG